MADPTLTDTQVQNIAQAVAAAVQGAMQQNAQQTAQQIAEQVGQAVSQAIQKFMQTTGATTVGTQEGGLGARTTSQAAGERIEDIGGGEAHERSLNNETGVLFANTKRTYDEYQHESLEGIRYNRRYVEKVLSESASHDHRVRQIAEVALSNAVDTANLVNKQAVAHRDIAIDREWNVDEVSNLTAKTGVQQDIVAASAAAATAAVIAAMAKQAEAPKA